MEDNAQGSKADRTAELAAKRAELTARVDRTTELAEQRTDLAAERTDMAVARTLMAASRTLMSWVRTGLSLMGFGFALYQFLLYLMDLPSDDTKLVNPAAAELLGIIMVCMGILCMVLGLIEYFSAFRQFGRMQRQRPWGYASIIAIIAGLLGLFLLFMVVIKKGAF